MSLLGYEIDRLKRLTWGLSAKGGNDSVNSDETFQERWNDVLGEILPGLAADAPSAVLYRDTDFLAYHYRHDRDQDLSLRFQLSHQWNRGEVKVHVHFIPCVAPGANPMYVVWQAKYAWSAIGAALPAATGWTTVEARSTIASGDEFTHKITPLFSTTPTEATTKESSILCVRLSRLGSSAPATPGWTDTYTTNTGSLTTQANILLLSCDAHYEAEKMGTITEIPT